MPTHAKDQPSVLALVLCLLGAARVASLPPVLYRARAVTSGAHQHPANPGRAADIDSRSREERRNEAIMDSILVTLHMEEPPSPEVIARVKANLSPEELADALRQYEDAVREHSISDSIIPTKTPIHQPPRREVHQYHSIGSSKENVHFSRHLKPVTLFFGGDAVSSSRHANDVADAKLKLYLRPHPTGHAHRRRSKAKTVTCSVYMVRRDNTSTAEVSTGLLAGSEVELLDSRELSIYSPGWKTFHISPAVRAWLDGPQGELALVVTTEGRSAEKIFDLEQGSVAGQTAAVQPRVEVLYHEASPVFSRERRQAGQHDYDCSLGDGVTTCCRYGQNVSYSELGWSDWIIQPSHYVSYQCAGDCPTNFRPATAYSRIKSLMHAIDPDDWNAPCCAPTRFGSTAYLFVNGTGGLEIAVQRDSVVLECQCL
ncbi:bone morphogenetic protein 5-like [Acanthaster planci]|uniref:Bone morphogenetic protein 5-like n=1 Tax=Acanthaster planci TaxID=133434 RepID=A0A8B7Y7Z9_ACAPL|nr:bone morphogenetic protein 5-like [Acanthaster planci]